MEYLISKEGIHTYTQTNNTQGQVRGRDEYTIPKTYLRKEALKTTMKSIRKHTDAPTMHQYEQYVRNDNNTVTAAVTYTSNHKFGDRCALNCGTFMPPNLDKDSPNSSKQNLLHCKRYYLQRTSGGRLSVLAKLVTVFLWVTGAPTTLA